jgi:molecular chaperone GrpE
MRSPEEENTGPVIRDRRRIDPQTGQVRDPGQSGSGQSGPAPPGSPLRGPGLGRPGRHSVSKPGGAPGSAAGPQDGPDRRADRGSPAGPAGPPGRPGDGPSDEATVALMQLAERTADLQRLQAEYANYRKRVERDRVAVRERALASVLGELLPILDDIGRAREHEELTGGFKAVAESLESAATKLGLTTYGENGDPFDPNLHEALMHSYSADVTEPTCVRVLQPGYKIGDLILRPARVAVAEPADPAESADLAGFEDLAGLDDPAGADTGPAQDAGRGAGHDGSRASDPE